MAKPQNLELLIQEATTLMMENKHLESEEKLREIDEAAEQGNLVDSEGNKINCDHEKLSQLHQSDLYDTQTKMKALFDQFHDMLDEVERWEKVEHLSLVENEIQMFYSYDEELRVQAMAQFDLDWKIEEVLALFYEEDLYQLWMKAPTGDPMTLNNKVCDTLFSMHARVPITWPLWDRFGSIKIMAYLDPSCNGLMVVTTSHDEEKEEFFGEKLPKTPDDCVRVKTRKMFRYFEKTGENQVRFMMLTDSDIGLGLIPEGIKNQVIKQKVLRDLPGIKKDFANMHSAFAERVQKRPDFYRNLAEYVAGED